MNARSVLIRGKIKPEYTDILTPSAQAFLAILHRNFEARRCELLEKRASRQRELDAGILPDFLPHTEAIRANPTWQGATPAPGLVDRRVEITGPVDRKMVINALNSNATQFMADFEDSSSPTWENLMDGHINLRDALLRKITFDAPTGKRYSLTKNPPAVLLVRPRGWHLDEAHFLVDGKPISASLFDFGLYFFHNARQSLAVGQGPYFYLPKMESHLEARLWNDVFNMSQDYIGIPRGTIRATVLIETLLAAFEMDEIIYELREHSAGLNCGRWDYIFSMIKKLRHHRAFVLPDRATVTMTVPFMQAYVDLLIQTCHKRKVHAMGGMAAQIPIKSDPKANEAAMVKVRMDKEREAKAGHDGTWVAHPDLIPIARQIFDLYMPQPNQMFVRREEVKISARELLNVNFVGEITEKGMRDNISVALQYIDAWLRGNGCVPISNLMEDAATAEIARSQLWQWIRHCCKTADTQQNITREFATRLIDEEYTKIKSQMGANYPKSKLDRARHYLLQLSLAEEFTEFLTSFCYSDILVTSNLSKL